MKVGDNEIKIEFEVGKNLMLKWNTVLIPWVYVMQSAANYSLRMHNSYPYDIHGNTNYIPNAARNFVRKAQSDFGWDWGPAFVPAGIWQNIR